MTTPSYNDVNFRAQFPAFASLTAYPQAQLSAWWTMGTAYISLNNAGCVWTDSQAQLANDLIAAHLAQSFTMLANGQTSVVMTGATEGSVTISMAPPPVKSAFGYWLATTPYGAQLRTLLMAVAGVGLFVGGSLDRASFRKAGGVF